jgi:L-lactate dehydrogenase (cytochrome)/(S)-mandelate dehydrogenase
MQVFIYRDRGFTRALAERAAAAGYDALVLTIDNQLLGRRERDLRNGFTIPPRYRARDAFAMATKVPCLCDANSRASHLAITRDQANQPA